MLSNEFLLSFDIFIGKRGGQFLTISPFSLSPKQVKLNIKLSVIAFEKGFENVMF